MWLYLMISPLSNYATMDCASFLNQMKSVVALIPYVFHETTDE
jgi:hypothetical protein